MAAFHIVYVDPSAVVVLFRVTTPPTFLPEPGTSNRHVPIERLRYSLSGISKERETTSECRVSIRVSCSGKDNRQLAARFIFHRGVGIVTILHPCFLLSPSDRAGLL